MVTMHLKHRVQSWRENLALESHIILQDGSEETQLLGVCWCLRHRLSLLY